MGGVINSVGTDIQSYGGAVPPVNHANGVIIGGPGGHGRASGNPTFGGIPPRNQHYLPFYNNGMNFNGNTNIPSPVAPTGGGGGGGYVGNVLAGRTPPYTNAEPGDGGAVMISGETTMMIGSSARTTHPELTFVGSGKIGSGYAPIPEDSYNSYFLAYGSKFGLGGRGGRGSTSGTSGTSGTIIPDDGGRYGGGGGGGGGTRYEPGQNGARGGGGVIIFIEE